MQQVKIDFHPYEKHQPRFGSLYSGDMFVVPETEAVFIKVGWQSAIKLGQVGRVRLDKEHRVRALERGEAFTVTVL